MVYMTEKNFHFRRTRSKYFVLAGIILLFAQKSKAQSFTLLDSLEIKTPLTVSSDAMGHLYLLTFDNQLQKYDTSLEVIQTYTAPTLSGITTLDARQMLKVFAFNEGSQQFQFFDRFLTPSPTAQVKSEPFSHYSAACLSSDQMLWLYDENNMQLIKYNPVQQNIVSQIDLGFYLPDQAEVKALKEYGNRVYLWQNQTIMVFDFLGTLINTLPIEVEQNFYIHESVLYHFSEKKLMTFNLQTQEQNSIFLQISGKIQFIQCIRQKLLVLTDNRIWIYSRDH